MRVELEQDAIADVRRATDYYSREGGDELGERFREAVLSVLEVVAQNPQIGSPAELDRVTGVRSFPLSTFPFRVFYTVDANAGVVTVRAVPHSQRGPDGPPPEPRRVSRKRRKPGVLRRR